MNAPLVDVVAVIRNIIYPWTKNDVVMEYTRNKFRIIVYLYGMMTVVRWEKGRRRLYNNKYLHICNIYIMVVGLR